MRNHEVAENEATKGFVQAGKAVESLGHALNNTNKKTPEKDLYATPPELFAAIQKYFRIEIAHDVCAEPHTAKCPTFWTKEDDALSKNWGEELPPLTTCFMNPPYSKPN